MALALDSGGPFEAELRRGGVPVDVAHMRHQLDLGRLLRMAAVRRFRPDVVMSRGVSGAYVGELIAIRHRARHVYNDHTPLDERLSWRREVMVRAVSPHLAQVIVVSEDQRQRWLAAGVSHRRIVVIPNGVSVPAPGDRAQLRRELAIPPSAIVAVSVASLTPRKRVQDFVSGILRAREACPALMGLIVGDGPMRPEIERATEGDPAIRILGQRSDVTCILQAADLLVLVSEHEALPMAILEAMATGLPVVATRVGGVPGLVVEGKTGTLVRPADPTALVQAMVQLASDSQGRSTMGEAARELCLREHSADAMIDTYAQVLRSLVSGRQRYQTRSGAGVTRAEAAPVGVAPTPHRLRRAVRRIRRGPG
jgi:glycosyltransferase involved in cell wall biosynthesis